jgi:hypothetical protein
MPSYTSKLQVQNRRGSPHVVAVEPWGEDFTLHLGEELEITATGDDQTPSFVLVEWDGSSQVYCNDTDDFKVMQGDV